jgi:hypothetical protein
MEPEMEAQLDTRLIERKVNTYLRSSFQSIFLVQLGERIYRALFIVRDTVEYMVSNVSVG